MSAPLNRDQQIELMRNAKERHDARFQALISHSVVREALSRPVLNGGVASYMQEDRQIACC